MFDAVRNAKNLQALLTALQAVSPEESETLEFDQLMAELPTFGGEPDDGHSVIWSWDETHVLEGMDIFDMEISPRIPSHRALY